MRAYMCVWKERKTHSSTHLHPQWLYRKRASEWKQIWLAFVYRIVFTQTQHIDICVYVMYRTRNFECLLHGWHHTIAQFCSTDVWSMAFCQIYIWIHIYIYTWKCYTHSRVSAAYTKYYQCAMCVRVYHNRTASNARVCEMEYTIYIYISRSVDLFWFCFANMHSHGTTCGCWCTVYQC